MAVRELPVGGWERPAFRRLDPAVRADGFDLQHVVVDQTRFLVVGAATSKNAAVPSSSVLATREVDFAYLNASFHERLPLAEGAFPVTVEGDHLPSLRIIQAMFIHPDGVRWRVNASKMEKMHLEGF